MVAGGASTGADGDVGGGTVGLAIEGCESSSGAGDTVGTLASRSAFASFSVSASVVDGGGEGKSHGRGTWKYIRLSKVS